MKHFVYINSFAKLNLKKDSSLFLALSMKELKKDVYLLFEEDLAWTQKTQPLKAHEFSGTIKEDFYLENVTIGKAQWLIPKAGDTIHMRLDPPLDGNYLRALWLLKLWKERGVHVLNDPSAIMLHNEKILAYNDENSVSTWIGQDPEAAFQFIQNLDTETKEVVLKPLDLFSGLGVEKWKRDDAKLLERLKTKAQEVKGAFVVQPYLSQVEQGELRVIAYQGVILGSILKVPKKGEFISNIAHGGKFQTAKLTTDLEKRLKEVSLKLASIGLSWVAFDVLGDIIQEANVTCPGLLVEVSHAMKKNLAKELIKFIESPESDL
jgi:glutathione synthase